MEAEAKYCARCGAEIEWSGGVRHYGDRRRSAAGHDAVVHEEPDDLEVVDELGAVVLRRREEPQRHPHGVHRRVGHADADLAAPALVLRFRFWAARA